MGVAPDPLAARALATVVAGMHLCGAVDAEEAAADAPSVPQFPYRTVGVRLLAFTLGDPAAKLLPGVCTVLA